MDYRIVKTNEKIVHIPDEELAQLLERQKKALKRRWWWKVRSPISTFKRRRGLEGFLLCHSRDRFFVVVDFVHAFHQITKEMIEKALPKFLDSLFVDCLVDLGGKRVIPIGFETSNYIFELFLQGSIDKQLKQWADNYEGNITRHCDNILVTWKRNSSKAFQELIRIFDGFEVRFTPRQPRKWEEPIRFCGIVLPRKGTPRLSNRRKRVLLQRIKDSSSRSAEGVRQFIGKWSRF